MSKKSSKSSYLAEQRKNARLEKERKQYQKRLLRNSSCILGCIVAAVLVTVLCVNLVLDSGITLNSAVIKSDNFTVTKGTFSYFIYEQYDYFLDYYETLHPVVFLSYEREAYFCKDGGDFRVTFDDNILCRQEDLSLESDVWGTPILEEGKVLMEIKCSGGIPLWMTHVLSQEHIYKTSFSKYGTAYQTMIFPNTKGGLLYA